MVGEDEAREERKDKRKVYKLVGRRRARGVRNTSRAGCRPL